MNFSMGADSGFRLSREQLEHIRGKYPLSQAWQQLQVEFEENIQRRVDAGENKSDVVRPEYTKINERMYEIMVAWDNNLAEAQEAEQEGPLTDEQRTYYGERIEDPWLLVEKPWYEKYALPIAAGVGALLLFQAA